MEWVMHQYIRLRWVLSDVYEVTVDQFREFVNQSGYKYGGNWDTVAKQSPGDEYPMIYVNRHNFQVTTT